MKKILVMMIVVWFAMTANAQVKRGEWLARSSYHYNKPCLFWRCSFFRGNYYWLGLRCQL